MMTVLCLCVVILSLFCVRTVQSAEPDGVVQELNVEIKESNDRQSQRQGQKTKDEAAASAGGTETTESVPNNADVDDASGGDMKTSQDASRLSFPRVKGSISPKDRYRKLFNSNRVLQLEAVKSIHNFNDYAMKYKLISTTLEQLFKVLEEAKVNLTEKAYIPGDPFPEDDGTREALSKVFENTAMFGDLVLRIPDIVHRIYDKKRAWHLLLTWSVWFCNESDIFIGPNAELLHLMAQEVDLIPKEPDFLNPFREKVELDEDTTNKSQKKKQKREKKMKEKVKRPRLSKPHMEL